jgi:hypothetical protein
MRAATESNIQGRVSSGFENVREAFAENFIRRHELGGACCALLPRREGRRSLGRRSEEANRRAWEENTRSSCTRPPKAWLR